MVSWPIGLASRTAILVGIRGNAIRPLRRSLQCSLRHWWRSSILSFPALGRWGMLPGSQWAAAACRTWLWWPCCMLRGPTGCGVRVKACYLHTDWNGEDLWHPSPHAMILDSWRWDWWVILKCWKKNYHYSQLNSPEEHSSRNCRAVQCVCVCVRACTHVLVRHKLYNGL